MNLVFSIVAKICFSLAGSVKGVDEVSIIDCLTHLEYS